MPEWTLAAELKARGWDLTKACIECKMDKPTMEILVRGGQTLPQLAMRLGRALDLTPEQVQTLGKPLNKKTWLRPDSGLPVPKRINFSAKWYEALDKSKPQRAEPRAPIWINTEAIAQYMWDNGMDMGEYFTDRGFRFSCHNLVVSNHRRRMRIEEAEEILGMPQEVVETTKDMSDHYVTLRFDLDRWTIWREVERQKVTPSELIDRYIHAQDHPVTRRTAANAVERALGYLKDDKPVTYAIMHNICALWRLNPHDVAQMLIIKKAREGGSDAD